MNHPKGHRLALHPLGWMLTVETDDTLNELLNSCSENTIKCRCVRILHGVNGTVAAEIYF